MLILVRSVHLKATPAVLARPDRHPFPIDPHAAPSGLVEAFDEVLELRQHLLIAHGLGRLVDVHHHGPLEVCHCAGYRVHAVVVGERPIRERLRARVHPPEPAFQVLGERVGTGPVCPLAVL